MVFAAEFSRLVNSPKKPCILGAALGPELTSPFSQADAIRISEECVLLIGTVDVLTSAFVSLESDFL